MSWWKWPLKRWDIQVERGPIKKAASLTLTVTLFEIRFAIKLFTFQPVVGKYSKVVKVHIAVVVEVTGLSGAENIR